VISPFVRNVAICINLGLEKDSSWSRSRSYIRNRTLSQIQLNLETQTLERRLQIFVTTTILHSPSSARIAFTHQQFKRFNRKYNLSCQTLISNHVLSKSNFDRLLHGWAASTPLEKIESRFFLYPILKSFYVGGTKSYKALATHWALCTSSYNECQTFEPFFRCHLYTIVFYCTASKGQIGF